MNQEVGSRPASDMRLPLPRRRCNIALTPTSLFHCCDPPLLPSCRYHPPHRFFMVTLAVVRPSSFYRFGFRHYVIQRVLELGQTIKVIKKQPIFLFFRLFRIHGYIRFECGFCQSIYFRFKFRKLESVVNLSLNHLYVEKVVFLLWNVPN